MIKLGVWIFECEREFELVQIWEREGSVCESGCVIGSGQGANFIKISVKNMSVKGGFAEMSDLREKTRFQVKNPVFRVKSPFSIQNPVFSSKKVIWSDF